MNPPSASQHVSPPRRFIFDDSDMKKFMESPAKADLLKLTAAMGKSCAQEMAYSYDPAAPLLGLSPSLCALHGSLRALLTWISDFPAVDKSLARFGNPAFRSWHDRLVERSISVVYTLLLVHKEYPEPKDYGEDINLRASQKGFEAVEDVKGIATIKEEDDRRVVTELAAYLNDCFGQETRLDYGTGHECSFQVFLFALCKLGCFGSTADEPPSLRRLKAVTISIWSQYLQVTRQLQTEYMLEPAGSHGVWGLDDYHCLPFYFGACQLQNNQEGYSPESIHDDSLLRRESDTFLYFGCIRYIKTIKTGVPFFESSPMLDDISHLVSWSKVASGLLRLFEGEVLSKRQVVQHFVFGEVFAANWTPSQHERKAPTEIFRAPARPGKDEVAFAPTRAPWAT